MPGPKPVKKPRPKNLKWSDETYSFFDCDKNFEVGTVLWKWSEDLEDYVLEDADTYELFESEITVVVDNDSKISSIS